LHETPRGKRDGTRRYASREATEITIERESPFKNRKGESNNQNREENSRQTKAIYAKGKKSQSPAGTATEENQEWSSNARGKSQERRKGRKIKRKSLKRHQATRSKKNQNVRESKNPGDFSEGHQRKKEVVRRGPELTTTHHLQREKRGRDA